MATNVLEQYTAPSFTFILRMDATGPSETLVTRCHIQILIPRKTSNFSRMTNGPFIRNIKCYITLTAGISVPVTHHLLDSLRDEAMLSGCTHQFTSAFIF
jgi:hypothetical protein